MRKEVHERLMREARRACNARVAQEVEFYKGEVARLQAIVDSYAKGMDAQDTIISNLLWGLTTHAIDEGPYFRSDARLREEAISGE